MVNYTDVRGAELSRWDGGDDDPNPDDPQKDDPNALVEEMYFDVYSGQLVIILVSDGDTYDITIPIKATEEWNEFVDSLPKWDV